MLMYLAFTKPSVAVKLCRGLDFGREGCRAVIDPHLIEAFVLCMEACQEVVPVTLRFL